MHLSVAPLLTGSARRMITLCEVLRAEGLTVGIAGDPSDEFVKEGTRRGFEAVLLPREELLSRRNRALLHLGRFGLPRVGVALVKQNWRMAAAIRAWRPDVVWTRGAKGVAFTSMAAALTRRPVIWDIAAELPSKGRVGVLHSVGLGMSAAVVFQYQRAAAEIFGEGRAAKYAHKIRAIIPGLELSRLREARAKRLARTEGDGPRVILQVGTISHAKNPRFILERLLDLKRRGMERVEFWLAGAVHEQAYCDEMVALAEREGVSSRVRLLGWRNDVHDLIADADVVVLPSYIEGVPNAVQEAMYIGVPVVASDVGGMPEIIRNGDTGWALPVTDKDAWTDVLASLVGDDPRLRQEVGARAAAVAEVEFGYEKWGAEYARLVEQMAGRRRAS
jgi:glycosyltransferase involved in cell wall biosynthesis